jgi:hypothetical protein
VVTATNVEFTLSRNVSGYACIGFTDYHYLAHSRMDTVCGMLDESGQAAALDMFSGDLFPGQILGTPRPDQSSNIIVKSIQMSGQSTSMQFSRSLQTGDLRDQSLDDPDGHSIMCHWSVGQSFMRGHEKDQSSRGSFNCSFQRPPGSPALANIIAVDCNADSPCADGGSCVVASDGVASCPASNNTNLVLIVVSGFCCLVFIIYLLARMFFMWKERKLKPFAGEAIYVASALLTIFDFATDGLFISYLSTQSSQLPELTVYVYISIATLALPFTINIVLLVIELKSSDMVEFWAFFNKHQAIGAVACILAGTNCSLFNVIASQLLHLECFSAPLPRHVQSRLSSRGIVSNVLEDAPQLVIQIMVAVSQKELVNSTVIVSIVVSAVTLLFSFTKRLMVGVMNSTIEKVAAENNLGGQPQSSFSGANVRRRSNSRSRKKAAQEFFEESIYNASNAKEQSDSDANVEMTNV